MHLKRFFLEDSHKAFPKSPRCARVRPALRRNQASLLRLRFGLTVAFGKAFGVNLAQKKAPIIGAL